MNFIRLLAGLALFLCGTALTACAPQPSDCARTDVFCVGLVTAFEGVENHGLNQATWERLQGIKTQAQIARLDSIESVDPRDWQKNMMFFADYGYDVIVTVGTNLADVMGTVAAKYPDISFIGIDQRFDEGYENVATIDFPEEQAGFLAGLLAGMVSQSGKVGAVCETSGIDDVWQYCEGFRAGALYENEEIEITVVYRESGDRDKTFNDPEWGKEELVRLIDKGIDIMTGFGGNTAQGAFLAASEQDILVIGSEEDLYYRLPDVQTGLVTSIVKEPGMQFSSLVLLALQGKPISGPHAGEYHYATFRLPQFQTDLELKMHLDAAMQGIRSGEIEIKLPEKKWQYVNSDSRAIVQACTMAQGTVYLS